MKNSGKKTAIEFSLLLCTYKNDNPMHLNECLDSILSSTIQPSEMIIVKDGPLTQELDEVLTRTVFPFETNTIQLPNHQTQGLARREGVLAAKHNWISLMDSDDVLVPDRFEIQLASIDENPEIDIVGGQIAEFDTSPTKTHSVRKVPTSHTEIVSYAKKRNPFNAMTVMFKKRLALLSGNFRYFPGFEDYDLWVRMMKNGAFCQNCKEVLVYVRTGEGMYKRRRGLHYIRRELRMQILLMRTGMTTKQQFVKNLLVRIPSRLLSTRTLERLYKKFLRSRT